MPITISARKYRYSSLEFLSPAELSDPTRSCWRNSISVRILHTQPTTVLRIRRSTIIREIFLMIMPAHPLRYLDLLRALIRACECQAWTARRHHGSPTSRIQYHTSPRLRNTMQPMCSHMHLRTAGRYLRGHKAMSIPDRLGLSRFLVLAITIWVVTVSQRALSMFANPFKPPHPSWAALKAREDISNCRTCGQVSFTD